MRAENRRPGKGRAFGEVEAMSEIDLRAEVMPELGGSPGRINGTLTMVEQQIRLHRHGGTALR